VSANYAWLRFYEAALLEANPEFLPDRIESAQNAIGQRVITVAMDEAERHAIVRTLAILKCERLSRSVCHQCRNTHDLVTSMTGKMFFGKNGDRRNYVDATHEMRGCMGGRE
jgi:hypothetical protein